MKPGWTDLKYTPNRPQRVSRRSKAMLVHPSAALRSKLNYEQYRQREVAVKGLIEVPAVGVPGERVSPGEALERGLNYAQYRPDDAPTPPSSTAEVAGDPSLTMPTTGRRQAARAFVDRGMGGDTDTILANAGRWAGPHLFTLNLLFSADPGLVALVAATGSDPEAFTRDCTDQFVCDLFRDRGWGETVAFSYVVHVNHDEQGRLHPHAHITAPGTIVDDNGERQTYPYIDKMDTLAAQQVASTPRNTWNTSRNGRHRRRWMLAWRRITQRPPAMIRPNRSRML